MLTYKIPAKANREMILHDSLLDDYSSIIALPGTVPGIVARPIIYCELVMKKKKTYLSFFFSRVARYNRRRYKSV